MEPEVHIIEKYFQEILHCFTMTNIRCKGGKEIDILAINPTKRKKYHIESRVSTIFKLRERATKKKNGSFQRDGLDYFKKEKFEHPAVLARIKELFGGLDYEKVLVVHSTEVPGDALIQRAWKKHGIRVLLMKDIIADLKEEVKVTGSRDDVIRFVELIARESRESNQFIRNMLENEGKKMGMDKREVWKRLMRLMKVDKRTELLKLLKIDKKTSTQRIREEYNED
jgi:hypothetical protein